MRLHRSVMVGCAALTTMAACANRPDTSVDEILTFKSPPLTCRYAYRRDNVPQGFGSVMLAASEMEF